VLLTGETGTGKELAATVIHDASPRSFRPFIKAACQAPSEVLLETELFADEPARSSGAHAKRTGIFSLADGGTVFLDEIGELALPLQAKLVRFLDDNARHHDRGSFAAPIDVQIVAATARQLEESVERGRFRRDLHERLNRFPIAVPPLRARTEDIPLLIEYFIDTFNAELGKNVLGATTAAYQRLQRYGWPGNVRELRNVVERAMLLSGRDRLDADDFAGLALPASWPDGFELPALGVNLEALEQRLVVQALERCRGNQTRAAALLGLNRDQIRYRVEKFGIDLGARSATLASTGHEATAEHSAGALAPGHDNPAPEHVA